MIVSCVHIQNAIDQNKAIGKHFGGAGKAFSDVVSDPLDDIFWKVLGTFLGVLFLCFIPAVVIGVKCFRDDKNSGGKLNLNVDFGM